MLCASYLKLSISWMTGALSRETCCDNTPLPSPRLPSVVDLDDGSIEHENLTEVLAFLAAMSPVRFIPPCRVALFPAVSR